MRLRGVIFCGAFRVSYRVHHNGNTARGVVGMSCPPHPDPRPLLAIIPFCLLAMQLILGIVQPAAGAQSQLGRGAPRSVLDLQTGRIATTITFAAESGEGKATLTNLNPHVGSWFLLELKMPDGSIQKYHLENPRPATQRIELDSSNPEGVVFVEDDILVPCKLWPAGEESPLLSARQAPRPYVSLCDGRAFLRNATKGQRTRKEWAAELLRDRVRYGEQITTFFKEKLFRDRYLRKPVRTSRDSSADRPMGPRGPAHIRMAPGAGKLTLSTGDFNLVIAREPGGGVIPGRWHPLAGYPGVHAAVVTPDLVSEEVLRGYEKAVSPLEPVETSALVYLVAFDLNRFELGFSVGTDHPRVNWSNRVPEGVRVTGWGGPDGFDTLAPLARTGKLNPWDVSRAGATFAGGFKRTHGAFKWGALSTVNHGSHYGFIENGVILSRLNPGLATILVNEDGEVDMRTWTSTDASMLPRIRHARQNGVPIVEPDPQTGVSRPGRLVREWGAGNWSGSEQQQLRTLRAGVCLQENGDRRFLIYGYFTSVTPSAMARVFLACQCRYAMLLDMNAPEHTYLALYRVQGDTFLVQRLVKEMATVDPPVGGQEVPRFIGYSDNRDCFYLLRKPGGDGRR